MPKDWLPTDWYIDNANRSLKELAAERNCSVEAMWERFRRRGSRHHEPPHKRITARDLAESIPILHQRAVKPPHVGDCGRCSFRAECAANSGPPRYGALLCEHVLDLAEERAQLAGAERVS